VHNFAADIFFRVKIFIKEGNFIFGQIMQKKIILTIACILIILLAMVSFYGYSRMTKKKTLPEDHLPVFLNEAEQKQWDDLETLRRQSSQPVISEEELKKQKEILDSFNQQAQKTLNKTDLDRQANELEKLRLQN